LQRVGDVSGGTTATGIADGFCAPPTSGGQFGDFKVTPTDCIGYDGRCGQAQVSSSPTVPGYELVCVNTGLAEVQSCESDGIAGFDGYGVDVSAVLPETPFVPLLAIVPAVIGGLFVWRRRQRLKPEMSGKPGSRR
jgi:hypothetical protein